MLIRLAPLFAVLPINTQHSTFTETMKKLFTLFICTLSLLLAFSSCSGEAEDVESVNKQTILVFMPWTGNTSSSGLYSYFKTNLDSISQGIKDQKGLNNTRVMVFFSETYNKSVLYDLQYDESTRSVNQVAVKEYEGSSYNSAEGIADILNEVKTRTKALNYAMIIGAHGCGWTYASDWVNYPYRAKPQGGATSSSTTDNFSGIQFGSDPNHPKSRFFGSVNRAEQSIDIETLAAGIQQSGIKMQYMMFDACYMGNVETAYALKDVTNYLLTSSSEVMGAGLPYRTLWKYLNTATPNYTNIVSSTVNFYNKSTEPFCNFAAIDCREIDNLASVMKDLNSQYKLASTVPLDSIQPLDGFSPNLFYDMQVYVDSLHPSGYLKEQFTNQLKATVKSAQSTEYAISYLFRNSGERIKIKSYCGLSISDPSLHSVATKGREKTGWWKATHE